MSINKHHHKAELCLTCGEWMHEDEYWSAHADHDVPEVWDGVREVAANES